MASGALALVLHGHLPYVRSRRADSLEEDWFFQALVESYLPLLGALDRCRRTPGLTPRLTMSLSPTLLSLLTDPLLLERFPGWLARRRSLLDRARPEEEAAAQHLDQHLEQQLRRFETLGGQPLKGFRSLLEAGVLDLLTCSASHGYLPLLRDPHQAVQAQLRTAVREHERLLGQKPSGIWLAECAYFEGLDAELARVGLRYAVLDAHGLLHGLPRPRYGVYAPICSPAGVAFFARDSEATLPVWSASDGYPGHGSYREFHRDLGWDLPEAEVAAAGLPTQRPLGLKLRRVSGQGTPLDAKEPYEPAAAAATVRDDAEHYVQGRLQQLLQLALVMDRPALLVAPFDAELFGHWWFEGPAFLEGVLRSGAAAGLPFVRLRDALADQPQLQVCRPSPSSWGQGGYHGYWLNRSNDWVVPRWHRAAMAMVAAAREWRGRGDGVERRLLRQAGRELLLAQASDWSFILRAGTTTDLARDRIERHLERFQRLLAGLPGPGQVTVDPTWLGSVEAEDALFPTIDPDDWAGEP